ncbi:MAG: DUF1080 domain-containing protein [Pirellulales bacterium]
MSQIQSKTRSRRLMAFICVGCLLFTLQTVARSQELGDKGDKGEEGFVPLFNGKDLSGWQTTGNWVYEPGGVLALKPTSRRRRLIPDHQSFLWSRASYADFVLDLEFKVQRGSSSGVFMRSSSTRSYLQTQIRDSHGQQGLGNSTAGAVVDVAAPKKNMSKRAGEWNHMIITCDGNRMQVELNGEEVVNADLSKSQNARSVRSGRIGFENASSPVAFRNVRIKELKRQ